MSDYAGYKIYFFQFAHSFSADLPTGNPQISMPEANFSPFVINFFWSGLYKRTKAINYLLVLYIALR